MQAKNVSLLALVVALFAVIATLQFYSNGLWLENNSNPKLVNEFFVDFKVAADRSQLQLTCKPARKEACLDVMKGHAGLVKFAFKAGKEWQLTRLKICKGTSKADSTCDLNIWERLEFFVASDESGSDIFTTNRNGTIDLTGLPAGSAEFFVLNQNVIKGSYFYSIEACAGAKCISTDPPIKNRGRL